VAPAPPGRGILLVVAAVSLFSLSDVLSKLLAAEMGALQVTALRYGFFLIVALALAARARAWRSKRPALQVARGLTLLGSATLFILGLGRLGVAEATAVSFVTPVIITVLSVWLLKEQVRLRRWAALGIGLAGVLVVLRPGGEAFRAGALFPLGSALCGAAMVIVTRAIGGRDRPETTMAWSAILGAVLLAASAPVWFEPMDLRALGLGAVMGLLYAAGQYLLILAYSQSEASLLAPFSYAQLLTATALAFLVFGAGPDAVTLGGIGLIALGGVYTLYREGVLSRLRRRPA
jgi:drug/metabolite transporter (DMT)-like permease